MRLLCMGIVFLGRVACLAADGVPTPAFGLCSGAAGAPVCKAPAKDLKAAHEAFARGLALQHGRTSIRHFRNSKKRRGWSPKIWVRDCSGDVATTSSCVPSGTRQR